MRDVCVRRRNTNIKKKNGEASENENSVSEISVRKEKGMKLRNVHSIQVGGLGKGPIKTLDLVGVVIPLPNVQLCMEILTAMEQCLVVLTHRPSRRKSSPISSH